MGRKPYQVRDIEDYRIIREAIDYYHQTGEQEPNRGHAQWRQVRSPQKLQVWIDDYLEEELWLRIKRNLPKWRKRRDTKLAPSLRDATLTCRCSLS